ncbi:MAG: hypothetical protein WD055_03925 [Candidatus Dependentiae bacterium]
MKYIINVLFFTLFCTQGNSLVAMDQVNGVFLESYLGHKRNNTDASVDQSLKKMKVSSLLVSEPDVVPTKKSLVTVTHKVLRDMWFNKTKRKAVFDINHQLFVKEDEGSGLRYIFNLDPLECHQSVSFNALEDALLICTDKRILLHDIKADKNQTIVERDHSEIYVSAKFNRTENSILICTNKRILLFDINQKAYKVLFNASLNKCIGEACWNADFDQSESSVVIHTSKRIIHHDLETLSNRAIFRAKPDEYCRSFCLSRAENIMVIRTEDRVILLDTINPRIYDIIIGNKNIKSALFSKDEKEIIICTDNAVNVYSIQNRDLRSVFKVDACEKCQSGMFNRSKDRYCLLTNKRILLFNAFTGLFQQVYKKDNIQSVVFNDQENELLVSTEHELFAVPFI